AARSDAEHYASERRREEEEIVTMPEAEAREVRDIFKTYGLTQTESASVVDALRQRPQDWVDFMMRFELGLEKPEPGRALKSALTIALSYVVGGIIPLSAYLVFADAHRALNVSCAVTLIALLVFAAVKGRFRHLYFVCRHQRCQRFALCRQTRTPSGHSRLAWRTGHGGGTAGVALNRRLQGHHPRHQYRCALAAACEFPRRHR